MNRRSFFGALAAVVAAGKAAPSVLARLRTPGLSATLPGSGFTNILEHGHYTTLHGLSRSTYPLWDLEEAKRRMTIALERQVYGEAIPWPAWDEGSRRAPIGYAAWERQVLG